MTDANPRRRRWIAFLAVLAPALLGLHTVAWWVVTGRIIAGLPAAAGQAALYGWQVVGDPPERTGWPWTAAVRLRHFAARRTPGVAPIAWTAETLLVTLSPLDPLHLRLSWAGDQVVTVGDRTIPFHATQTSVVAPLRGGPVDVGLSDLVATPWPGTDLTLLVTSLKASLVPLAASVVADGIAVRPPLPPPLDGPASVSVRLLTTAPVPDADTPAAAATAWRVSGGRIELPSLSVSTGPLQISGRAEGGLDAALQPQGQATLRVNGAASMLDVAARAGLLAPSPARAARAVLQLLALSTPAGPVPLTVTLDNRTLTVANFPLLRLPPMDWDAP